MNTSDKINPWRTPMQKRKPVTKIAAKRSKRTRTVCTRHGHGHTVSAWSAKKYTTTPSQIPFVVEQLRAKGKKISYVIFDFEAQADFIGQSDNTVNLQYALQDGVVGLEWVLICQRNIADKKRIIKFITQLGYNVTEHELNDVHYLRVVNGDIVNLGMRIVTEFYQLDSNAEVDLFVNGFNYKLGLRMADVMRSIRLSGEQPGFLADVERISAVLRLIHGKSSPHEAFAEFKTFLGSVRFTDVIDKKSKHILLSEVQVEPATKKLEKELLGKRGINLLSACGFLHTPMAENFEKRFSVATEKDIKDIAEFCVGILHLLFEHQPGHPLEIDFFMPGPVLEDMPKWEDLPEPLQASYGTFKARYHDVMAQYHSLMSIESLTLTNSQKNDLMETCTEMENVMDEFPSWLVKLKKLGLSYDRFFSYAADNQTELIESLNVLRRHYSDQLLH